MNLAWPNPVVGKELRSYGATDVIMMEMPFKSRYLRKKNMFTPRMGSLKFNAFQ